MTDAGREVRHHELVDALQATIEAAPERFLGVESRGGRWDDLTLHVADLAAVREPALAALLDDAQRAGIAVAIVPAARPLAVLRAVQHAIGRRPRSFATTSMIELTTATVRVRVAVADATEARSVFAGHGDAPVLDLVPVEEGLTAWRSPSEPPPADWPVPPVAAADGPGRQARELVARYRAAGFVVEVYPYGYVGGLRDNLQPNRLRLIVRDGIVVDARQG